MTRKHQPAWSRSQGRNQIGLASFRSGIAGNDLAAKAHGLKIVGEVIDDGFITGIDSRVVRTDAGQANDRVQFCQ